MGSLCHFTIKHKSCQHITPQKVLNVIFNCCRKKPNFKRKRNTFKDELFYLRNRLGQLSTSQPYFTQPKLHSVHDNFLCSLPSRCHGFEMASEGLLLSPTDCLVPHTKALPVGPSAPDNSMVRSAACPKAALGTILGLLFKCSRTTLHPLWLPPARPTSLILAIQNLFFAW